MSKEKTCPDFIKGATNVYRTKKYIVKQRIDIEVDMEDDNVLISYDTYYVRTQKRDKEYEYGMSEKTEHRRETYAYKYVCATICRMTKRRSKRSVFFLF